MDLIPWINQLHPVPTFRPRNVGYPLLKKYLPFIRRNTAILAFGFLLSFFSSFGQTFALSLFVPAFQDAFDLHSGHFGTLYAIVSLGGALCLPALGRILDKSNIVHFAMMIGAVLAACCWLIAVSSTAWVLFTGLFGLRMLGAGMLTLMSSTTMARMFASERGKALSVASLGHPAGEGLLPMALVTLQAWYGWRTSWTIIGAVVAATFFLVIPRLVAPGREFASNENKTNAAYHTAKARFLHDVRFYLLLPGILVVPFMLTGLFLYQSAIAEWKGWSMGLMASGFIGFAVARSVSSFVIGPAIDRLGPARYYPFSLVPLTLGMVCLWLGITPLTVYVFFVLCGISQGIAGIIMTAIWAQLYGTEIFGHIKGVVMMLVSISAATAPALFGWLLAAHVSFDLLLPALCAACAVAVVISVAAKRICFSR